MRREDRGLEHPESSNARACNIAGVEEQQIYALARPHPHLLRLYVIRAILSGPFIVVALPLLLFRYHTLRYRFDAEGVHMQWGFFFRREVNLTYARIQDIHLRSGFIQRWLGLADLLVQTASGSALPEMTIEGFKEYEELRDFFYTRMRGTRAAAKAPIAQITTAAEPSLTAGLRSDDAEAVTVLREIRDELRRTREALARRGGG